MWELLNSNLFESKNQLNWWNSYITKTEFWDPNSSNKILRIPINWLILWKRSIPQNPFMQLQWITFWYEIKELLYNIADNYIKDAWIKAIVLEINSPWWTIVWADAIQKWVEYLQSNTQLPIYTSIAWLGASWWYWAWMFSDKVYASVWSMVWSIWVITWPYSRYKNITEQWEWLLWWYVATSWWITNQIFTAWEWKDIWNPYRDLTDKEKNYIRSMLDEEYNKFVSYVSDTRELESDTIKNDIWAYLYTADQWLEKWLIDWIASPEKVYEFLAETADIDNFKVITLNKYSNPLSQALYWVKYWINKSHTIDICTTSSKILAFHGNLNNYCN